MKHSRRQFIKASAAFGGWSLLPSKVWSSSPNSRLSVAHIGVGGMGARDLERVAAHPQAQTVAVADVYSPAFNNPIVQKLPTSCRFTDYREMLHSMGDQIDAVVVSAPDHTHFPATRMALEMDKHVYCQKPLTHTIPEAHFLYRRAKETKVRTQMGIQCHSLQAYRMAVDLIQQGIIGKVSKVYVWSSKKWGYDGAPFTGSDPVPASLDWDLWLRGRPERPFLNGKYHPQQWRRILDYGSGTMGDMGVHILDTPCTALNLGLPQSVRSTCREPNGFSHPTRATIEYVFPGSEYTTRSVQLTWFEGKDSPTITPPDNPDFDLAEGKRLPSEGALFIGEDGRRMLLPHHTAPQPLPRELLKNVTLPKLEPLNHYFQWVDACLGKTECGAPFEYASGLTAMTLFGVLANQFPGQTLQCDPALWQFSQHEAANQLLHKYDERDGL